MANEYRVPDGYKLVPITDKTFTELTGTVEEVDTNPELSAQLTKPGWTTSEFIGLMCGLAFNIFIGIVMPILGMGNSDIGPIAAMASQSVMQYKYNSSRQDIKNVISNILQNIKNKK